MNPRRWPREHQVAWVLITALGAVLGLLLGWLWSPFSHVQGLILGEMFIVWLRNPGAYWPWPVFGVALASISFYSAKLLTHK